MSTYSIPIYRVLSLVRDGSVKVDERPYIRSSVDAYNILKDWFLDADRESFVVVALNAKNRVIGINQVSVGSLSSSIAHPREIFKPLILLNSAAFLASHNHPSGDHTPSQEDMALTRRLREAGELLGIKMIDHLIVCDSSYFSFKDEDRLDDKA